MHKYIAHQQQNGAFTLSRDGYNCNCPKSTMVVPVQSQMGGGVIAQPQQLPCSTHCPFASIQEGTAFQPGESGSTPSEQPKNYYIIECEGGKKQIELSDIKLNKSPHNGLVAK